MERLTDWINEEKTEVSIRHDRFRDAMIRLAAYEDTGLEPCEIPVLLDRLKRASEQWNIWYDAYQKDVPEWIPVVERTPEKPKENPLYDNKPLEIYLVSVKNTDCVIRAFWNGVSFTDGWEKLDVLAWMPLPEPYKEAEG